VSESLDQEIRTLRAHFWSARDPEGRAFVPLAEAYRQLGDLDEALSLVRDGLDRLPDFASGHLVASRVARDRGDLLAAREHLDRVLDLDPENVLALLERADARASEADGEGAAQDLRAALELDPGNPAAVRRLADLEDARWASMVDEEGRPAPASDRDAESHRDPPSGRDEEESEGFEEGSIAEPHEASAAGIDALGEGGGAGASLASDGLLGEDARFEEESAAEDFLLTRTMAELYAKQGLYERAAEVYVQLVELHPEDTALAERLRALEAAAVEEEEEDSLDESVSPAARGAALDEEDADRGRTVAAPSRHREADAAEREELEALWAEVGAAESDPTASDETGAETADLAPALTDVDTADRTAPAPTAPAAPPPDRGPSLRDTTTRRAAPTHGAPGVAAAASLPEYGGARTIARYLEDLLAWVPGAVPIESLAPEGLEGARRPASSPSDPDMPGGGPEPPVERADADGGDTDDFDDWLRSLRS
jgi:tetratricopeptide (TPR) repeat protein